MSIHRIAATITEKISVAGAETQRVCLDKPADQGEIEAVPEIVNVDLGNPLTPLEHEAVSVCALTQDVAAPVVNSWLPKGTVKVFLHAVAGAIQEKADIAPLVSMV